MKERVKIDHCNLQDIEATAGFKFFDELSGEDQQDIKPTKEQLNHMMLLNLEPQKTREDYEPSFDSSETDHGYHGDENETDGKKYHI